jgi:hypothetical protein
MSSPTRDELVPALKRFNRWQFIEAQTGWTELAEKADGVDRDFLMAMAHVAGSFARIWHKGGEPQAMVSLLTAGVSEIQKFGARHLDLELEPFTKALTACLEEAKRWRRGDTDIFNRDLIPRLDFVRAPKEK